ncbi:hypothetical protein B0H10DRAFT_864805 [Mycena sp. CBHHK59/15]|nr:hypothetical protein B0H10DRAFT_864805 [Mycena sp. CBHHK59/15]
MLTFFTVLAILPIPLTLAAGGAVNFLLVPDPTGVTQCDPYTIKWQGGTPPYSVTVQDPVNAGDIYAFWAVVEDTSIEWTVDDLTGVTFPLAFLISVVDATGDNAMSRAETIQAATVPLDSSGLCTTTGSTDSTSSSSSSSSSSTTSASSSAASTNSNTKSQTSSETASQASKPGSSASAIFTASAAQSSNSSATSTADASSASGAVTTTKEVSSGAIAGAVVGGVALLAFVGTAFQTITLPSTVKNQLEQAAPLP